MQAQSLAALLPANLFAVLLVASRVGAALAFLPGFSASYIPMRVKAVLMIAIALIATPQVAASLPPLPSTLLPLAGMIAIEIVSGAFIGLTAAMLVAALDFAGGIIALQSNLASALVFNPGELKEETLPASLMQALALVLIFTTDIHYLFIDAVFQSYRVFPAGVGLPMADLTDTIARTVENGFEIAIGIAAPYLILGTLFNLALGLVGRVMPQLQIFYVGLPLQILGGLALLLVTVPAGTLWFLGRLSDVFTGTAGLR